MKLNRHLPVLAIFCLLNCSQDKKQAEQESPEQLCAAYYQANKGDSLPSQSLGSTGKGKLVNGKLMPYKGKNFRYFDTRSYLAGRAFVHHRVKATLLDFYKTMDSIVPAQVFYIMECSDKDGGRLIPHNTHQNGLSVDLMMPKIKAGKPYTKLDTLGIPHYWLVFDDEGRYSEDTSIRIDFELLARQILLLQAASKKQGLTVAKVIIKIELKDELFIGHYGGLLKQSGIYIVRALTPNVNDSHDEHIHVDFEVN